MDGIGGVNGLNNRYPLEDNTQSGQGPIGKTRSGRKVQKVNQNFRYTSRESRGYAGNPWKEYKAAARDFGDLYCDTAREFMGDLTRNLKDDKRAADRFARSLGMTLPSKEGLQLPKSRGKKPRQQPVNNSGKVDQPVGKDPLRQQWFDWSFKQFQGKGYAPPVAKTMADRVLSQCGSDYRAVKVMVDTTPSSPQAVFRQHQQQNYQWAMGQFTAKGYHPDRAHQAITDALNMAGTNLTKFQQWVVATPDVRDTGVASPEYIKNELRPWMIQEIEKKGFAPAEAQAVADNLIQISTGNVDELRQSVQELRPKDARPQVPAEDMEQRNVESLETLGLTKDASLNDVKKAYRKLAMKLHPDKNPGNAESNQLFQKISEAHRHLTEDSNLFKN
ncbi:J domain-containing protein [Endozoicomonas sp. YOMI1]|uniref:J domain-containing protein n=1 Tax=Endozoicomonas sp. YOMI1 TaxID=2828739 RepID=UPI0021487F64|nr:J domain-containing protein [Endozoicomonas sp. YOMI1]